MYAGRTEVRKSGWTKSEEQGESQGLFRIAALQSQRRAALGSIQINTPPAFWAVSVLAVAFVAAAIIYLFLGHYTQRARVQGTLVPASGLVTLNAASAGDVLAVDVHQGERVSAGQTLASVDNPLESAALGNTLAFITAELNTERKGLEQDPATQRADLRPGARRAHLVGGRLGAQGAVQRRDAGGFHRLCGSVSSAGRGAI